MVDFREIVETYYEPLYRFALSLSRSEGEAKDLVQQTFALWARKGHQLRDETKVKAWLFTTLRREFLATVRRSGRFSDEPLGEENGEGAISPGQAEALDADTVMRALMELPLEYREPLTLFYLREMSYTEIAEILEIPVGTVMSRLSRGKNRIRRRLSEN